MRWTWPITSACRTPTTPFDPYGKLDRKTLKALANRLVRECGMSPTSIDEMTVDDMLWWLTD